jgi:hypothetical protein
MREFDIVKKTRGHSDIDMIGLVLKITINKYESVQAEDQTIVTVLTRSGVKSWYQPFLDVISSVNDNAVK